MNMKYNVSTISKKRNFQDISASNGLRKNPFEKKADKPEESQIDSSAFQSAVDTSTIEKPVEAEPEIAEVEAPAVAPESAIDLEW